MKLIKYLSKFILIELLKYIIKIKLIKFNIFEYFYLLIIIIF